MDPGEGDPWRDIVLIVPGQSILRNMVLGEVDRLKWAQEAVVQLILGLAAGGLFQKVQGVVDHFCLIHLHFLVQGGVDQ